MVTTGANIFIKPKDIWGHFTKHSSELLKTMEPVAQNDDYDVIIYLANENNLPCLIIESSNVNYEEFAIKDKESCEATVNMVYELYLTDQIITVMMQEEEEMNDAWSESLEDIIIDREADLESFVERFLEDVIGEDPILYSLTLDGIIDDCKEHFLEYLYRKHKISVYRPMELEDDEGVFFEEYPYECMEFTPNPLYDD